MSEEQIPDMINEIFDKYDIEDSLKLVEEIVQQMEELIAADSMWENAVDDETSRRVLAAAIGVVALKFGSISDGMIDFLNENQ